VLAEEVAGEAVSEVNRPHAEHLAGWGGHAYQFCLLELAVSSAAPEPRPVTIEG
jgi:hypothetical protein